MSKIDADLHKPRAKVLAFRVDQDFDRLNGKKVNSDGYLPLLTNQSMQKVLFIC